MLQQIADVLIQAVLAGGAQVLDARRTGSIDAMYKDATELVTEADQRSDTAMANVFSSQLQRIDSSISFRLEESGLSGAEGTHWVGADPLDGTNHFAAGGAFYSVQAHYVEDGIPLVGVVFQPEIYLPFSESAQCLGRLAYAIRLQGAQTERTEFTGHGFIRGTARKIEKPPLVKTRNYVSCVPVSTKMNDSERQRAQRVIESGIVSSSTGVGGAGGNIMLAAFGGQHVYANFGAGEDLDLIPPQVIAEEAGLTVWGTDRKSPVWKIRKQPVVVAPADQIAERFLVAAGF